MTTTTTEIEITEVKFVGNSAMLLSLSNDRTCIVPLEKFKQIESLTPLQKEDFEIIDGENLSFLALDEVYSIHELIGI
ncbi:MAG: DUF2442 domain-containing protein [Cytophagales bacterium]|jgi:hypothetical protein|nr:DUF2442 domain-containing protein [Cytophagales bacterium]MCA6386705.1 DUF2442 domain-containing protein [Cytophagales bacterium]MCA6392460.1 DUF2442 domain-containing protein [Cytophagales bacterium]MCA6394200.1 DUF2442 domain-containing protein [Cytophagales bacterium]MCA6398932.1 DUF2442 domain-containing protein [Cytophagales bacterium]